MHNTELCLKVVGKRFKQTKPNCKTECLQKTGDEKAGSAPYNRCSLVCGEYEDLGPRRSAARDGLNTQKTHTYAKTGWKCI